MVFGRIIMHLIAHFNLTMIVTVGVAALSSLVYLVVRFRGGQRRFTPIDATIMVLLMAIVSTAAVPLSRPSSPKSTANLKNLFALRSQIALYKIDHDGKSPLCFQGALPQLLHATNAEGVPGPPGNDHPFGPYFHKELPGNPVTGKSVLTLTAVFPPVSASGSGGWLYHQASGQIAADSPDLLDR